MSPTADSRARWTSRPTYLGDLAQRTSARRRPAPAEPDRRRPCASCPAADRRQSSAAGTAPTASVRIARVGLRPSARTQRPAPLARCDVRSVAPPRYPSCANPLAPRWLGAPDRRERARPTASGRRHRPRRGRRARASAASPRPRSPRVRHPALRRRRGRRPRPRRRGARAAFDARVRRGRRAARTSTTRARRSSRTEVARWMRRRRASTSTSAPAASSPSRSPPASTPRASASTATTSRVAEIDRAVERRRRRDRPRQRASRSSGSPTPRPRARPRAARAPAREQRRARPHPRVPRHRPRGPEVRRRRSPDVPATSSRAIRSHELARASSACTRHIGSQIFGPPASPRPPAACSPCTRELLADGPVPELNLGGGFGIAYTSGRRRRRRSSEIAARPRRRGRAPRARELGIPVPALADRARPLRSSARRASPSTTVGTIKDVERAGADGATARAPLRLRRRRHERQRPPRPLRRRLHGAPREPRLGCRPRARARRRQALRVAATSSCTPTTCPATSAAATCSPCPRPARTAVARQQLQLPRPPARRRRARRRAARVIVRGETEDDLLARDAGHRSATEQTPMIEYRNLRVALLGAGIRRRRRSARLLLEHGDELASRVGAPARARRRRRARPRRAAHAPTAARAAHHRRRERSILGADIVVELMGGIEPARELHPARRSTPAPTSSPATRRCSPRTAPSCSRPPSRSARSCTTRPPSAARSRSSARCATASPATACSASSASSTARPTSSSTGWTRRATASRRRSPTATELGYAEADPTADIEGYDAAQKAAILAEPRLPHRRAARGGAPRGHHRRHRRRRSRRPRKAGLRRQAARHLRAAHRRRDGVEGVSARVLPGAAAAHAPARRRARREQRRLRRGGGRRRPHVLRRGRRRRRDRVRRARRPRLGRPPPRRSAARASPSRPHADLPVLPIGSVTHPLPDHARGARTSRACSPRIAGICSASTASRSRRVEQSVADAPSRCGRASRTATLVIGTHAAPEAALAATVDGARAPTRSSAASTSVLRVEGVHDDWTRRSGAESSASTPTGSTSPTRPRSSRSARAARRSSRRPRSRPAPARRSGSSSRA